MRTSKSRKFHVIRYVPLSHDSRISSALVICMFVLFSSCDKTGHIKRIRCYEGWLKAVKHARASKVFVISLL